MYNVVWINRETTELQYCSLNMSPTTNEINGSVISVHQGKPLWVKYTIQTRETWQTKRVEVQQVYEGNLQGHILDVDQEQKWYENGEELQALRGCEDIDLGVTPATNLLPIQRLKLMQNEGATITVAWMQFPELSIEKSVQKYKRLGRNSYEYRSNSFTAVLDVDDHGMVARYGSIWEVGAKYVSLS